MINIRELKHTFCSLLQLATEAEEDDVELNATNTWSDFNRVYFHPKSMVTISGYQMNSEFMPFDVFSYGRAAFTDTEKVQAPGALTTLAMSSNVFVAVCGRIYTYKLVHLE